MTDQQRSRVPPPVPPPVLPFSSTHALEGVCRRLAPEDVRAGQFVAVFVRHHDAYRVDERTGRIERQRVAVLPEAVVGEFGPSHPGGPAGVPLAVVAVALPFVVARRVQAPAAPSAPAEADDPVAGAVPPPEGPSPVLTLDLRQVSLAEVGQAYARAFEGAHAPEPARAEPHAAPAGPGPGDPGDGDDRGGGGDGGGGGGGSGPRDRPSRAVRLARRFRVARWRE
ncbi:MAG: hypothetical protein RIB58_01785 [Phycisphaerales bacterium]